MNSTIWIFVAIAVIQFLVQAVAKASEKRKKALLNSGGKPESGPQTPPTSAVSTAKVDSRWSGTAASIVESMKDAILEASGVPEATPTAKSGGNQVGVMELRRQRRIEALRRRQEAIVASEASPNSGSQASAPPASNRPAQRPPRPPAQPPVTSTSTPARRTDRKADSSRRSNQSRGAKSPRKAISDAKSISNGQIGTRLRKRLRDPRTFREAFVLSELLQPPVAMRKPSDQG